MAKEFIFYVEIKKKNGFKNRSNLPHLNTKPQKKTLAFMIVIFSY